MAHYQEKLKREKEKLKPLLDKAQEHLLALLEQKRNIEIEIVNTRRDIEQMAAVCGVPEATAIVRTLGLTNAIRWILSAAKYPMNPPQIRAALDQIGFDTSQSHYKNVGAAINTTLKRLVKLKQVREYADHRFAWAGEPPFGLLTMSEATAKTIEHWRTRGKSGVGIV